MQQSPLEPYFVPNFHMMKKSLIKKTTNQHCSNVRRVLIVCVRSHWLHGQDSLKTLPLNSGFEVANGRVTAVTCNLNGCLIRIVRTDHNSKITEPHLPRFYPSEPLNFNCVYAQPAP